MLTLETLQANLRRLAERLEYGMNECDMGDALDFDGVAGVLYALADGVPGDVIADDIDLPSEDPLQDEDEEE